VDETSDRSNLTMFCLDPVSELAKVLSVSELQGQTYPECMRKVQVMNSTEEANSDAGMLKCL
jgi:hypothetical protein